MEKIHLYDKIISPMVTEKSTNLSEAKKGSLVNIEIDILSKYVKNFFHEKK